jgi:hypothetical protein
MASVLVDAPSPAQGTRRLRVVVANAPAAALKAGVVLIQQPDHGTGELSELWAAVMGAFRPTSIPTWSRGAATGGSSGSDWVRACGCGRI